MFFLIYCIGEENGDCPFSSSHKPFRVANKKNQKIILFARLFVAPYIQYKRRYKMCEINMNMDMTNEETEKTEKVLIGKRSALYRRLWKIRDILPGSFSSREALCGKTNCACRREGKRHKVNQYSFKIGEKQITRSIPNEYVRQVQQQVLAKKEFKKIVKQIYEINLEILFEQLARNKNKQKQKQKQEKKRKEKEKEKEKNRSISNIQ